MVFSLTTNSGSLNRFDMNLRPNQIGDPYSVRGVRAPSFGDARRDSLYALWRPRSISTSPGPFDVTERFKLQFRYEVFHAMNSSISAIRAAT
jgi:hypothetical protein